MPENDLFIVDTVVMDTTPYCLELWSNGEVKWARKGPFPLHKEAPSPKLLPLPFGKGGMGLPEFPYAAVSTTGDF